MCAVKRAALGGTFLQPNEQRPGLAMNLPIRAAMRIAGSLRQLPTHGAAMPQGEGSRDAQILFGELADYGFKVYAKITVSQSITRQ